MTDALLNHLRRSGEELTRRFEEASELGAGTSQEVADFREGAVRQILGRYFPHPHRLAKGKIFDPTGGMSASVDCVLLNPEHPNTVDSEGKYSFLLADGVDCAVEVKPDLSQAAELERGLKQARSVKQLRRAGHGLLLATRRRANEPPGEWRVAFARRVPFVMLADKAKEPAKLVDELEAFHDANEVPIIEQFDSIVVNGVGILSNKKHYWAPPSVQPAQPPYGYVWEEYGDATLAVMIFRMATMDLGIPRMASSIISRYMPSTLRPANTNYWPRSVSFSGPYQT